MTTEQSEAWLVVWEALIRHNPAMHLKCKSGIECALHEIKRLQVNDLALERIEETEELKATDNMSIQ